jgi:hypothetical protein
LSDVFFVFLPERRQDAVAGMFCTLRSVLNLRREVMLRIEEDDFTLNVIELNDFTSELVKLYIEHELKLCDALHKNTGELQQCDTQQQTIQEKKDDIISKPDDVWTKEEDECLRKVYPNMTASQIIDGIDIFSKRSEQAIYDRANFLGLRKLKPKEDETQETSDYVPSDYLRAPNKTKLFLNWLEENKIRVFKAGDFLSTHQDVTEEELTKIISYQIRLRRLHQMKNDTFRVII